MLNILFKIYEYNFFANIGPDLAKTIKGTKKQFSGFLSLGTDENFVFANMTPDIINDALKKLKSKKTVLDQTKFQQIC